MLGYTTLTIGIALILRPAPRDVAAAAVLGTVVGVLRLLARGRRSLEVLMPFLAAFAVALLTALAVKHDVTDPGLRAMIAAARRLHPRRRADHGGARADRGPDDLRREPARLGHHLSSA